MTYSPRGCAPSTIGAGGLNCRVRDGTGCYPSRSESPEYDVFYIKIFFFNKNLLISVIRSKPRIVTKIEGKVKPSTISTAQLNALLRLHLLPINLVVSLRSYLIRGRSHLEDGFALRCFQRLS